MSLQKSFIRILYGVALLALTIYCLYLFGSAMLNSVNSITLWLSLIGFFGIIIGLGRVIDGVIKSAIQDNGLMEKIYRFSIVLAFSIGLSYYFGDMAKQEVFPSLIRENGFMIGIISYWFSYTVGWVKSYVKDQLQTKE